MKKIVTFGCSYTAGHGRSRNAWYNWPSELALLLEDKHQIINAAKGGTSVEYSAHAFRRYFEKHERPDLVIFQITTPFRLAWITDEEKPSDYCIMPFHEVLETNCPNYKKYDQSAKDRYGTLTNLYSLYMENHRIGHMTKAGTNVTAHQRLYEEYYGLGAGVNPISLTSMLSAICYVKYYLEKNNIPYLIATHDRSIILNSFPDAHFLRSVVDIDFKELLDSHHGSGYFESEYIDSGRHISPAAIQNLAKLILNVLNDRKLI